MILLAQGEKSSRDTAKIESGIEQAEELLRQSESREGPIGVSSACLTLGSGLAGALIGHFFGVQELWPFVTGAAAGLATGTAFLCSNASTSKLAETVLRELKEVRAEAVEESATVRAVEA